MTGAKLGELPAGLVAAINAANFLEAFRLPERGRYVARPILPDERREAATDASRVTCAAA